MKNTIKLAAAGALFAVVAQAMAAEITLRDNVQTLNVALTGYVQGNTGDNLSATRVRITTKDIVSALGGTTRGRLYILTPFDYEGDTMIVVRERNTPDVDVTGSFAAQTIAVVESSKLDNNGIANGQQYSIEHYMFGGPGNEEDPGTAVWFDVQGFTTSKIGRKESFKSTVNGTGGVGGADAVVSGSVSGSSGKQESRVIIVDDEEEEG